MAQPKTGLLARLAANIGEVVGRARMAYSLGMTYGGKRDLYSACGYPVSPNFEEYVAKFRREGIARRIVTAFPKATWKKTPVIYETDEETETAFEKDWKALIAKIPIFSHFRRIDILSGIGQYGVLFLGFDDGKDFSQPVTPGAKLIYLRPFSQKGARISQFVTSTKDPRYGLPLMYQISMAVGEGADLVTPATGSVSSGGDRQVHYTRVIHVVEDPLESEVYGTPRLESVFNRLQDIETVMGGGAEMFWRGGFPGLSLEQMPDADPPDPEDMDDIQDEIEKYVQGMQRYLRLAGMQAKTLAPNISSPKEIYETLLQNISGSTGIPMRILQGSERGELASSTDRDSWFDRVDERRKDGFAEVSIIRPFITRLVEVKSIASPAGGPQLAIIEFPPLYEQTAKEQMELSKLKMDVVGSYVSNPAAEAIIDLQDFFVDFLLMPEDKAEVMAKKAEQALQDLEDQASELMGDPTDVTAASSPSKGKGGPAKSGSTGR